MHHYGNHLISKEFDATLMKTIGYGKNFDWEVLSRPVAILQHQLHRGN